MIFVCFLLTSLSIIGSRFIYLIITDSDAFLFMAKSYSIVYMYHNFFIHSSFGGHLSCLLAIVNIFTKKMSFIYIYIYMNDIFFVNIFTIASKQLRCPPKDEWIKKLWYIYTMEYDLAIKRNASESVIMR